MTIDEIVGVVAVLDRFVTATFTMHVLRGVLATRMRHAAGGIHFIDLDHR
jgi:hypothetical protein